MNFKIENRNTINLDNECDSELKWLALMTPS